METGGYAQPFISTFSFLLLSLFLLLLALLLGGPSFFPTLASGGVGVGGGVSVSKFPPISLSGATSPTSPTLAVVVQGPASEDATMHLLTSFTATAPSGCGGAPLCFFSTLSTEATFPITLAYKEANFTIILTPPPKHPGVGNVNLQLLTSHAGVVAASRAGATHAVKMRGDLHLTHPTRFIQDVVGHPGKLTALTWIGYLVDFVLAGPTDAMEELLSPIQPPSDDRFPELFIAQQYSQPRGWDGVQLCRGLALWVDKEGRPVGGAPPLPQGMLYLRKAGDPPPSPASDLSLSLRDMVTFKDPCLNQLPPGCHHDC